MVQASPGEPVLGGPEAEHNSPENHYQFEWVDAARLQQINLLPQSAQRICAEMMPG